MRRESFLVCAVMGVLFVGIVAISAPAQQGTGSLGGRVIDQQGAVVPGVVIIARNEASGQYRQVISSADGSWFMSAMTPASYEITAQVAGFKKYQHTGVRIEVGKTQDLDVKLEVGGAQEVVQVSAQAMMVDTTSKELGGSVNSQELTDVPTLNRNFTSYLSLLPGVTASISTDSFGADSVRVNGQNVRTVAYALDGAGNNDNFNNGNGGSQVRVPVEAVQEFQMLTSQFDAEFGMAGGVVNAISKTGTNRWHGTWFTFFQNQKMTANNFFAEQQNLAKPETRQLQFGGNIGGPIIKDRLHAFLNLERIDQNRGVTIQIPARPEFNFTDATHDNVWNWMWRIDHQISANNTWALRYISETSPQSRQYPGSNWTKSRIEQEQDRDWGMVGTWNLILGHTKVNTLKISYTHEDVTFGNPAYFENGGHQELLGPELAFQAYYGGISTRASRRMDPAYQFDETFSWFKPGKRGDHDFKFGLSWYFLPLHTYNATSLNGTFTFSGSNADFDPKNPRTYPDRLGIQVPANSDFIIRGQQIGWFVQDKWKLNRNLTLSLGLRWDLEKVPTFLHDNYLFADPTKYPLDTNNFSPRAGFSWRVANQSVIRGGYGFYFQKTQYSAFNNFVTGGVYSSSFYVNFPANNYDPGPSAGKMPTDPMLVNGPVVNRALLNQMFPLGTKNKNTGTVYFDNPDRKLPYSRQFTIGYERQFGRDVAFSADFIRNDSVDLLQYKDLNPGLRTSTGRTATLVRTDPRFTAAVYELINTGWANYNAMQLSLNKRFSNNFQFRASYTLSRGYGNFGSPGNTETITYQVLNELNLEKNEGLTTEDRTHLLSLNGSVVVPHTHGLTLSGVFQFNSGTPFTLTDSSTDPDRNGFFQEPLPAGTYGGVGQNAWTKVKYDGGERGARGPNFWMLNMRAGYRFNLKENMYLQVHVDLFNVTDHTNFANPSTDLRTASTFLIFRSIQNGGPTRTAQLNVKFAF